MDKFAQTNDTNDRRWACPGFYRMPKTGDGRICRIKLPLGCVTPQQLRAIAKGSKQYGNNIIELTNRANIQIRGVFDDHQLLLSQLLRNAGLGSPTQLADDIRNVMINPTAGFDKSTLIDTVKLGDELLNILQKNENYTSILSPKFSFFIDGGEDTAYLHHAHDIWLSAINEYEFAFGFASSPSFYERNMALGIIKAEDALLFIKASLDLFLEFHKQDKLLNRFKHLFAKIERTYFVDRLIQKGIKIMSASHFICRTTQPELQLGKHKQVQYGYYFLNILPPLGRLTPKLIEELANIVENISRSEFIHITPWRGIVIPYCTEEQATTALKELSLLNFVISADNPYAKIISCAGAPLCQSSLSNVQRDAALIANILKNEMSTPIHLTGCAKSCATTNTYPITLLSKADGQYDLYKDNKVNKNFETGRAKLGQLLAEDITIQQAVLILKQNENDG